MTVPLLSKLFQGDKKLEACQVNDSDHLVLGTRGPHVKKLQQALTLLDGALIDKSEIASGSYGRSTAAAVLTYKQKRSIINRTYQTTADNIVGKMTITKLDEEILRGERRPPLRGCSGERGQGEGPARLSTSSLSFRESVQTEFDATLHVAFQFALFEREVVSPNLLRRQDLLVERAALLLKPFHLSIFSRTLSTFTYPYTVGERDDIDVRGVRKAAENSRPGFNQSLRVIFCHLRNTTSTATSQGH